MRSTVDSFTRLNELVREHMEAALRALTPQEEHELVVALSGFQGGDMTELLGKFQKLTLPHFPSHVQEQVTSGESADVTKVFFMAATELHRAFRRS